MSGFAARAAVAAILSALTPSSILAWSTLPQRRRDCFVVSPSLRLRLHGEVATRRNPISFTSTLIAAGLARSGEVCLSARFVSGLGFGAFWGVRSPVQSTPILNEGAAVQVPPNTKREALSDGRYLTGKDRKIRL